MASGCFIVFEGPEGAGKSTQIALLLRRLHQAGLPVTATREPGGTPIGDAIRELLLHAELEIDPLVEFLLYSASRAQNVAEVIRPALERGATVLCDRFTGASVAYQGYGRGLELSFVHDLNRRATGDLHPDLTVLLDLDPAEGLLRLAGRSSEDRLERAGLAFHRRVREGYLDQARTDPSWLVLGAARAPQVIADAVWKAVAERCRQLSTAARSDGGAAGPA